jgi:hypothetical protein
MWVPSWANQIGVSWGKPFRFIVASVAVHVLLEQPTVGLVELGNGRYLSAPAGLEGVVIPGHDDVGCLNGHNDSFHLGGMVYQR